MKKCILRLSAAVLSAITAVSCVTCGGAAALAEENEPASSGGLIALTFDDGPSDHTRQLLDIFDEYGGRCTFFVIGERIEDYRETLGRAAEMGHEIACHGWDHKQLSTLNTDALREQISKTNDVITSLTGEDVKVMRPPYGFCSDELLKVTGEMGISVIKWSVDTLDWQSKNAADVYSAVMEKAQDGAIILCHDLYGSTAEAMRRAVPELIERGYSLVTVSELLSSAGEAAEAGRIYSHG